MDLVLESIAGLPDFLIHFGVAVLALGIFAKAYAAVTPHNEIALIKENNPAAATSYVGALVGFVIPLYSALSNSVDLLDFALWAFIAMVFQILTFLLVRRFIYPRISERIEGGEMAAAIKLAGIAVAIGILNAGSMTT